MRRSWWGRPTTGRRQQWPVSWGERIFRGLVVAVALVLAGLVASLVIILVQGAWTSITQLGLGFILGTQWYPGTNRNIFGALPFIYGTIITSLLALLLAVPVSMGIAIFLSEQAPTWMQGPLGALVELLAAVPSVVYGFWGFVVLAPYMGNTVEPALQSFTARYLPPASPLFAGPTVGNDILTASVILAVMIIPTISALSREAMSAVPQSQREAVLSLGATRWESTRVGVLKYARSGIFGAVVLGLGRAVGETMAVTMTIGNADAIPRSLLSQGQTMASLIANEFTDPTSSLDKAALIEIALLLLIITIGINVGARLMMRRLVFRSEP